MFHPTGHVGLYRHHRHASLSGRSGNSPTQDFRCYFLSEVQVELDELLRV